MVHVFNVSDSARDDSCQKNDLPAGLRDESSRCQTTPGQERITTSGKPPDQLGFPSLTNLLHVEPNTLAGVGPNDKADSKTCCPGPRVDQGPGVLIETAPPVDRDKTPPAKVVPDLPPRSPQDGPTHTEPRTPERTQSGRPTEREPQPGDRIEDWQPGINSRLGCALAVSAKLHALDPTIPITNNNRQLMRTLQEHGYEMVRRAPGELNEGSLQKGDVIIGQRQPGMPGHAAIYQGNGRVFENNSDSGRITDQGSLNEFNQGMHFKDGKFNKNGFQDVFILRRVQH